MRNNLIGGTGGCNQSMPDIDRLLIGVVWVMVCAVGDEKTISNSDKKEGCLETWVHSGI